MRFSYNFRTIKVFYEKGDLSTYLLNRESKVREDIWNEQEDYILNVNTEEYIDYKTNKEEIKPLTIGVESAYAEQKEEMISAEYFPRTFNVYSGKSYPKMVVYFNIPLSGETELILYTPSTRIFWTEEMGYKNDILTFKRIQFTDNIEAINKNFESVVEKLKSMEGNINQQVYEYNNNLRNKIKTTFESRKQELLNRRKLMSGLVVPIKKSDNVSDTFSIPTPKLRKEIKVKPEVTESGYKPEPTLDLTTYNEILNLIHGMGKEFERKPSVYSNKDEEQLRDHFLMLLEPNFDGSATGETFNKKGKTDILLRYENNNVFIAECKFWKGKSSYLKTIDQLLSYLTWRDSKAAVIMFIRNKDFTNVINIVEQETQSHSNYLSFVNNTDNTWFNYRFHTVGDKNREVKLAVLLYHIPEV